MKFHHILQLALVFTQDALAQSIKITRVLQIVPETYDEFQSYVSNRQIGFTRYSPEIHPKTTVGLDTFQHSTHDDRSLVVMHPQHLLLILERLDTQPAIHLDLQLNHLLLHPQFHVVGQETETTENCFYHGHVDGNHNSSTVTLSTCDGSFNGLVEMSGIHYSIITNDDGTKLEPDDETIPAKYSSCGNDDHNRDNEKVSNSFSLIRRSIPSGAKFVELLVANDYQRVQKYGNSITQNTLSVANLMASRYNQQSNAFGRAVYITLTGIYNAPGLMWAAQSQGQVNADSLLSEFSVWRQQQLSNPGNADSALGRNDAAQLWSGRDFVSGGSSAIAGLSNVGQMCNPSFSAGVVEVGSANGQAEFASMANTAAHELGHTLGMEHDGTGSAGGCASTGSIMAPVSCSNCADATTRTFSACSTATGRNFLNGAGSSCLNNDPSIPYACGNGVVDTAQGEECDEQSSCCNSKTCRWVSGASCSTSNNHAGLCNGSGQCIQTCGNGVRDLNEDCDPSASANECCSPMTCKFLDSSINCSNGQCNSAGQCLAVALISPVAASKQNLVATAKPLTSPTIDIKQIEYMKSYHIQMNTQAGASIYYSVDGTIPVSGSTHSVLYHNAFDLHLADVLLAQKAFAQNVAAQKVTPAPSNPYASDPKTGAITVTFTMKAYSGSSSSQAVAKSITFNVNADKLIKQQSIESSDEKKRKTTNLAIGFGVVITVFAAFAAFLYFKPNHREKLVDRGRFAYQSSSRAIMGGLAAIVAPKPVTKQSPDTSRRPSEQVLMGPQANDNLTGNAIFDLYSHESVTRENAPLPALPEVQELPMPNFNSIRMTLPPSAVSLSHFEIPPAQLINPEHSNHLRSDDDSKSKRRRSFTPFE